MHVRHLFAATLVTAACSPSPDEAFMGENSEAADLQESEAEPLPFATVEHDDRSPVDDGDCVLEDESTPVVQAELLGSKHETLGRADTLALRVSNLHDEPGVLDVHAFVVSAHGSRTVRSVTRVDLDAGETTKLEIPVSALGLPTEALQRSGRVVLTTALDFGAGTAHQPETAPTLFFHPTGDGRAWEIYDAQTRDEVFEGGALTESARRFAREAEAQGSVVLDAHVHPWATSEDDDGDPDDPKAVDVADALDLGTPVAAGGAVNFCFRLETQFDDAGLGEDYWTSNTPTFREARGLYVQVQRYTASGWTSIFTGFTGDGIGTGDPGKGCTGNLSSSGPALYQYKVWARSQVQGNTIEAWDDFGTSGWILRNYAIAGIDYVVGGTTQVDVSTEVDTRLNTLMMVSYALYRHAGGLSGQIFRVRVDDETRYDSAAKTIYISDGASDEKFKGNHEVGHAIGDLTTGGMIVGSNYSVADSICPATADTPTSTSNHSLLSREHSEAAANEGFAHFYSADVFNDHDDTDCWFGYYKNEYGLPKPVAVNCESGNSVSGNPFSVQFLENECASGNSWPAWFDEFGGHGVELDWLRAFWDVHTNGVNPPHLNTMLNWIDSADEPGNGTAYDELDEAADDVGGVILTNWNSAVSLNGIDH